ncbi:hypothetical protein BDW42DRAFT_199930 [Aspergillus taichungensis]|uniref:Uncharacterized protein n=1 Tax=Aspergillus taichungensis TaxID=482145 RepID=A0A2J5I2B5_9EURO|nr:hypothetical protein BDW42DRAFT_199930 [Aspergillus taichungensis]
MASSSDDSSKLDQFGLYQLAEQDKDKEISPDTWGPGSLLNEDFDWAGLQNLLPPSLPTQNIFEDYFNEFEEAPTIPDALALPLPGHIVSESQVIPGIQIPLRHPQQSVQLSPQQVLQQHLQFQPQQAIQQYPQQAVLQYPRQAQQLPQQIQQVAQPAPQQTVQPTPGLAHQRIPSQGYFHLSHSIHPQIFAGAHMGANDQPISTHQTPENDMAQSSSSPNQNHTTGANTPAPQGASDAHNQITPQTHMSGAYQPGSTSYNAEENADVNITPHSEDTQVTAVIANEMRRGRAHDFPQPQQTDNVFSEAPDSPATQIEIRDDHLDRQQVFRPPVAAPGRPVMGAMRTEGGLVVGINQIPSFVPEIEELLDPVNSGADTKTIYPTSQQAREAMCVIQRELQHKRDRTIPTTDEQKRAIVKALFNAMKSLVYAEDNPAMKRPFVQGKYTDARLEAACWTLLDLTLLRHRQGPLLGAFSDKCRGGDAVPNFGQRIQLIMTALEVNKTIVKHVLDPNYTATLVDDPVGSMKRIVSNKQLNRRKGEYMVAGKELLQNEQVNQPKRNYRRGKQSIPVGTNPTPAPFQRSPSPPQTSPAQTQASGVMTRSQARIANSNRGQSLSSAPNMAAQTRAMHRATTRDSTVMQTPHAQRYSANYPITPTRHARTETQAMPNGGYQTRAEDDPYHPMGGLPVNSQTAPHARAPTNQNNSSNYNNDVGSQEAGSSSPLFVGAVGYGCATAVASLSTESQSHTPSTSHSGHGRKRQVSDAGFGNGPDSARRRY